MKSLVGIQSAVLILICLAMSGCVLPIPNRTLLKGELSGRVISAKTGAPIQGAQITAHYVDNQGAAAPPSRVTTSTADGNFLIPPFYQKHWGFLIGIALNYPLPYPERLGGADLVTSLDVSHPEFETHTYTFLVRGVETTISRLNYSLPIPEQGRQYQLNPRSE